MTIPLYPTFRFLRAKIVLGAALIALPLIAGAAAGAEPELTVLKPSTYAHYVERFNTMENENHADLVPNDKAWDWMVATIPFFECPDHDVEEIYYYRWWSLRKHLRKMGSDYVFTEFLLKDFPISSAAGHHLMEGRWARDQEPFDQYVHYWLHGDKGGVEPSLHKYSQWFADALYQRAMVTGDLQSLVPMLDDLVADYRQWEKEKQLPSGLFWQFDVRDAMEESISGSRKLKNVRPTINSYMYGNARAIAEIAKLANKSEIEKEFADKATALKKLTEETLWDPEAKFFEVKIENDGFSNAREEIGFIPWYFHLPDADRGYEAAWAQLTDPHGFSAPYGITTAERRHPQFRSHGVGTCEWDGAVWPFATSQTLVALGNLLRDYPAQSYVSNKDYFDAFLTYVKDHHYDGKPYLGEYLDEKDGHWLMGKAERSRYYNHSTFADLVIGGLVGIRARADETLTLQPLLPTEAWAWFCLDGVNYHHHRVTVVWDKDGSHYHRKPGFTLYINGKESAHADSLQRISAQLAKD